MQSNLNVLALNESEDICDTLIQYQLNKHFAVIFFLYILNMFLVMFVLGKLIFIPVDVVKYTVRRTQFSIEILHVIVNIWPQFSNLEKHQLGE